MSVKSDAIRDLRLKVSLEKKLHYKISKINKKLMLNTINEYIASGNTYDASILLTEYKLALSEHYENVGSVFSNHIRVQLPSDIAITDDEDEKILAALALFYQIRSEQQSKYITETNANNVQDSVSSTLDDIHSPDFVGDVTRHDAAFLIGAVLIQKLNSRLPAITSLETQAPAEAAKLTEAQVLVDDKPSVSTGVVIGAVGAGLITKEWVTMGDERVRPAHEQADAQEVFTNDAYIVGGEKMMYPGDSSLGASVGNLVNCRCVSVMDVDRIIKYRRDAIPALAATQED